MPETPWPVLLVVDDEVVEERDRFVPGFISRCGFCIEALQRRQEDVLLND